MVYDYITHLNTVLFLSAATDVKEGLVEEEGGGTA
jgi:hypothetical protein